MPLRLVIRFHRAPGCLLSLLSFETGQISHHVSPMHEEHLRNVVCNHYPVHCQHCRFLFGGFQSPVLSSFAWSHRQNDQTSHRIRELHAVRAQQIADQQWSEYDCERTVAHQIRCRQRPTILIFPWGIFSGATYQAQQTKNGTDEFSLVLRSDRGYGQGNHSCAQFACLCPVRFGRAVELTVNGHQSVEQGERSKYATGQPGQKAFECRRNIVYSTIEMRRETWAMCCSRYVLAIDTCAVVIVQRIDHACGARHSEYATCLGCYRESVMVMDETSLGTNHVGPGTARWHADMWARPKSRKHTHEASRTCSSHKDGLDCAGSRS